MTTLHQGKGESLVKVKALGNGCVSVTSRRMGYPITLRVDDELFEFLTYTRYVDAVAARGPYNVLTFESWRNAPKPIVHEKLGVIEL